MFKFFPFSKKTEFKFKKSERTACFTRNHVVNREQPILYVTRDYDDGAWQFLCGENDHDTTNAKVVSLLNIVEINSTVNDLFEMPLGYGAIRKTITDKWEPFKK
jgi:hypothetical protein